MDMNLGVTCQAQILYVGKEAGTAEGMAGYQHAQRFYLLVLVTYPRHTSAASFQYRLNPISPDSFSSCISEMQCVLIEVKITLKGEV